MKKYIIPVCTILFILSIGFLGFNYVAKTDTQKTILPIQLPLNGDGDSIEGAKLVLKNGIQLSDSDAKAYKFKKYNINKEDAINLAEKFKVDTSKLEEDTATNKFIVRSPEKHFWMEKNTGKWEYSDLTKLFKSSSSSKIPSDDECIKIAEDIIKDLGLNLADFDKGMVENAVQQNLSNDTNIITEKAVYFYRKFKGNRILGTSRLIIIIGDNGEIHSVKKLYCDIDEESVYSLKLKPIEKAFNDIEKSNGIIHYKGKAKAIEISSIKLAYWEDPSNNLLQPVYFFRGRSTDTDQEEFESYVTAVEEGQKVD